MAVICVCFIVSNEGTAVTEKCVVVYRRAWIYGKQYHLCAVRQVYLFLLMEVWAAI